MTPISSTICLLAHNVFTRMFCTSLQRYVCFLPGTTVASFGKVSLPSTKVPSARLTKYHVIHRHDIACLGFIFGTQHALILGSFGTSLEKLVFMPKFVKSHPALEVSYQGRMLLIRNSYSGLLRRLYDSPGADGYPNHQGSTTVCSSAKP